MLLKNLFRIINDYKFSLVIIICFEFIYSIKGYKGNRFNFSTIDVMSNNIPCPYLFLHKIKKILKKNNFHKFIDLGCGSGRVINFLNKVFPNKILIGIEYFENQYRYCKKIFENEGNIKIIQADFTKIDVSKYDADCYFFNDPFTTTSNFMHFIDKTINSSTKKKTLFIFVNYNKNVLEKLKNIQLIESYYVSDIKGYSIYCTN